jgi:hypothetical protein
MPPRGAFRFYRLTVGILGQSTTRRLSAAALQAQIGTRVCRARLACIEARSYTAAACPWFGGHGKRFCQRPGALSKRTHNSPFWKTGGLVRPARSAPQYSIGNKNVVVLRSASVMIHSVLSPKPLHGLVGSIG